MKFKCLTEEYPWVVVTRNTYTIIFEGTFKECQKYHGHVMTKKLYEQICQERDINVHL
jgi:hypothetical protein